MPNVGKKKPKVRIQNHASGAVDALTIGFKNLKPGLKPEAASFHMLFHLNNNGRKVFNAVMPNDLADRVAKHTGIDKQTVIGIYTFMHKEY